MKTIAEFPFDYDERTKQRLRWLRQASAAIDYHNDLYKKDSTDEPPHPPYIPTQAAPT